MTNPVDQAQRDRARDPAGSWCVTAPAGAGKTELLTQRVLALLAQVDEPEEILAITFTRKAAAEMQSRIIKALALVDTAEPEDAHRRVTWRLAQAAANRDRDQDWQLMRNPARLRILTIDGLCAALTRQMPVVTAFGGAPEPAEDPQPLYREAVAGLLLALEDDDPIAEPLRHLLLHLDNDWGRAERLLVSLLAKRDQWLRHLAAGFSGQPDQGAPVDRIRRHLDQTLEDIHTDALRRLRTVLGTDAGRLIALARQCAAVLEAQAAESGKPPAPLAALLDADTGPGWEPSASPLWRCIGGWLLTGKGEWRRSWDKRQGVVDKNVKQQLLDLTADLAQRPEALEALRELGNLPEPRYDDEQWALLAALAAVLPRLVQELFWVFQRHGCADFTEVALAALTALGSADQPGEALLALDHQLRHVLVDEFQDTSATQWLLLNRLLEGWVEHNAASAAPRTLFIVGDGMQSIYGFREADVGLFLAARAEGINGVVLGDAPLTVNFRSDPAVVEWINRHFAHAFPLVADIHRGAVPFAPAVPFRTAEAGSEVVVFGSVGDPSRDLETAQVVTLVRRALEEGRGDIAVLVRNRGHLARLIPALAEAGVPWRATDIDPLAQRAAVQDLLNLCRAMLNPADRISWLALLRSPFCGLDSSDLHMLVAGSDGKGRGLPVWQRLSDASLRVRLSTAGRTRLERFQAVLSAALAQRGRLPLALWLKGCWLSLGGAAAAVAQGQLADTERVFELLDGVAADQLDADALSQAVDRLFAGAGDPAARVQLMTLHRAKGLEFDTVIIPGLDRTPRSDDAELLLWSLYRSDEGREGLVLATAPPRGGEDRTYGWLRKLRAERQQLEATRLLYVGATRAERRLYLLFNLNPDAKGDIKPAANALLRCIWPTVEAEVQWLEAEHPETETRSVEAEAMSAGSAVVADGDPAGGTAAPLQLDWTESPIETDPLLKALPLDWQPPPWPGTGDGHRDNRARMSGAADNAIGNRAAHSEEPVPHETAHAPALAAAGRALHWLLERLAADGEQFWIDRDHSARAALLRILLLQHGVCLEAVETEVERLTLALQRMLADPRGRWLLFGPHHRTWQELDLSQAGAGRSIIDRCFIAADGQPWIIDYKLAAPAAGEPLAAFADRQARLYGPQLERYAALFPGRRPATALYFPLLPYWLELTAGRSHADPATAVDRT